MGRIVIIGTGLIGTSLGLAMKKMGLDDTIVGVDIDKGRSRKAKKMGALDIVESSLPNAVSGAGIVFISTPVCATKEVFNVIGPHLDEGCLITDTGGTKEIVLEWAKERLPKNVDFVGGHPMAGKESSGPDKADADLFENCYYCIVPGDNSSTEAVQTLVNFVNRINAKPYFIDAVEHDSFAAAVSHLPFLIASTLTKTASKSPQWADIARMAGSGFKGATRLASGDIVMHKDICVTNRDGIVYWINKFIDELQAVRNVIETEVNEDGLLSFFSEASYQRQEWLEGLTDQVIKNEVSDMPSTAETTAQLFLGERIAKKLMGGKNEPKPR